MLSKFHNTRDTLQKGLIVVRGKSKSEIKNSEPNFLYTQNINTVSKLNKLNLHIIGDKRGRMFATLKIKRFYVFI